MKAHLVAYTLIDHEMFNDLDYVPHYKSINGSTDFVSNADELAEFAGRACYESWDRPNPATATNEGYLKHIIEVGHFSVLEHASATFYLTGVSRSFTHELVRHRHMSFSQLSQRYVDESTAPAIFPPNGDGIEKLMIANHQIRTQQLYTELVSRRLTQGQTRKQAREAGRAVLPNATETRIVVTGNMRSWRELLGKRIGPGVDAAFNENAQEILRQLKELAPNTFQDM